MADLLRLPYVPAIVRSHQKNHGSEAVDNRMNWFADHDASQIESVGAPDRLGIALSNAREQLD